MSSWWSCIWLPRSRAHFAKRRSLCRCLQLWSFLCWVSKATFLFCFVFFLLLSISYINLINLRQQEKMALLSTIGFASAIGSRLFAGLFLDRFGPKITSFLSGILSITGLLLMATARDIQQLSDIITPAWVVLATGGSAMHLTSFHVTNLQIDKDKKKQASVYITAGFGGGSLILPILQIINQYGDVKLQTIAAWYAGVAAILTINSFFHQPWRAWNAIGSKASVDVNCFRRNWWPNSMKLTSKKLASDKKFMPLKKVLTSFAFWGECFWFSGHVFMLTYYLSTINQILYSLGDARVNDNIDSFLNNVFTRVAVFFNGLGFLWAPSIAFLSRTKSLYFRIYFGYSFLLFS